MKRIGIGIDGMCSDVSVLHLGPHFDAMRKQWPVLEPLIAKLAAGSDEEITCEGSKISKAQFYEILEGVQRLPGASTETHIGANCALEVTTAVNLLAERAPPIPEAAVDFLGFWSPRTIARVPEKIPGEILARARKVEDSEAVSLILPHGGKRAILSFGGSPPVRSLSDDLRAYLKDLAQAGRDYFAAAKPDLLIMVGTAFTFSAARPDDFELLRAVIAAARRVKTTVLCDLGGVGSWSREALAAYFAALADASIMSMNESELGVYYNVKTGKEAGDDTSAKHLAALVGAVARPGQGFLVHTPLFQLAYNLAGPVDQALDFAGKAASCRAQMGKFPTAKEALAAKLPISPQGERELKTLPAGFHGVAGYAIEVRNPVGLGDTWTCSFALSYLGGSA